MKNRRQLEPELSLKLSLLEDRLQGYSRPCIAFSGGADSSLLAWIAAQAGEMLAVTVVGPMVPADELADACDFTKKYHIDHKLIKVDVLSIPGFAENGPERCYYCKRKIFSTIADAARAGGCDAIMDGSNTDDLSDYRPGMKALKELKAVSPFLEAGISKRDIYTLSEYYGLPTWNKPAMACLASRIPTGTPISLQSLKKAEAGETILKQAGLKQYRLRLTEPEATIELSPGDLAVFDSVRESVFSRLDQAGIDVSRDVREYRKGSMNRS
ncbi:MAG: ATP-dependent sacrificial sulfur transferase LarE [Eubacteriaceae bacterium]|jgi:uncharacterized protein